MMSLVDQQRKTFFEVCYRLNSERIPPVARRMLVKEYNTPEQHTWLLQQSSDDLIKLSKYLVEREMITT
jgi:hypothetical protein